MLAAGSSSRFGSNKCRALLPNQVPMGIQSASNLRLHVDEMVVVVPPNNEPLKCLFEAAGFLTQVSRNAPEGMSESLKSGVRYFDQETVTAFVIAFADMPLISAESYQLISAALREDAEIARLAYGGRQGHPVGFNAGFRDELLKLQGDKGAKVLLQKHPNAITLLAVNDPGILQDFDTRSLFEQFFNEQSA